MALRVFMSRGTECWMISLKKFSPRRIYAVPQHPLGSPLGVPPQFPSVGNARGNEPLSMLMFVDQLNLTMKEALHLVAEPGPVAACATAAIFHAELTHELRERGSQNQHTVLGPHRFGAHPGEQQPGNVAEGELRIDPGGHPEGVGAVAAGPLQNPAPVRLVPPL